MSDPVSDGVPAKLPPLVSCPSCGASNYPHSQACWVCFKPLNHEPIIMATAVAPPAFVASSTMVTITTILVPVLLGIGTVVVMLDQQVVFASVLGFIAMAIAIATIVIGVMQGNTVNAIVSVVASIVLSVAVSVLVIIAFIILAITACFRIISGQT